jgi:hypothetical protein
MLELSNSTAACHLDENFLLDKDNIKVALIASNFMQF